MDKINIIDENITLETLESVSNEYNICFDKSNDAILWCSFGVYYGINHNLTKSEALSFGYVVSTLIASQNINTETSEFFNENKIIVEIMKNYQQNLVDDLSENAKLKLLFYQIYEFYNSQLENYTYKTESLSIRLSLSDKERLMSVPGKNKTEKIHNLIKNFK